MNNDNQVLQGLYSLSNVQDRLRIYAQNQDYFRFWALRQVNTITLLKIISEKFGSVPTGAITDWEFKYPEFSELPYSFYAAEDSDSTDATNTKIKVANETAALLNSTTRLVIVGLYTKETVTAHTHISATRNVSTGIVLPEEARVLSVGSEDSGGAGYTVVTLKRAYPSDSYTGTAPVIAATYKLVIANLVSKANSYPQPPVNKNSDVLSNYVQITRASYGVDEHMNQGGGIETFLAKGDEYLNISYMLAETHLMKTMERALIVARKGKKKIGSDLELEAGGINEFVPIDTDHYMDMGGKVPSVARINNLVRRQADISGVKEMWWFTGTHLSEQIANAYENKSIYYTNADLSVHYRMKIMTLESVGRDMVVHHVTAPILNELGMENESLCLNLTEYNYSEKSKFGNFQIAHKVPFSDGPKDAESFKSNEGYKGKWRELYGAWSLVRRLPDTHFKIINAAQPNN